MCTVRDSEPSNDNYRLLASFNALRLPEALGRYQVLLRGLSCPCSTGRPSSLVVLRDPAFFFAKQLAF
jgi:hypothetical protein